MERNRSGCTKGNGYLLRVGAGAHILGIDAGIGMTDFLNVICTGRKACHRDLSTCVGSMGAGYPGTAGSIRVDTELPAGQVLIVLRCFRQRQVALVQFVYERNGGGTASGNRDLLGIGAAAHILGIDGRIGMTKFFDVVCTCCQTRNIDLSSGSGRVWAGHQACTGRIGIDTKSPPRQVFTIFRRLCQTDLTERRSFDFEIRIQIPAFWTIQ